MNSASAFANMKNKNAPGKSATKKPHIQHRVAEGKSP